MKYPITIILLLQLGCIRSNDQKNDPIKSSTIDASAKIVADKFFNRFIRESHSSQ